MKKYSEYITLGYTAEGKRIRKHIYANTKKDLALEVAKAQQEFNRTPGQDQTWGTYSQRWKEVYKDMLNHNTVEMYEYALKHTEVLDGINLRNITEADCQSVITANWHHAETCRKINMTLNEIFKKAIKDKIITENPAADLTLPNVVKKPKRALTDKEKKIVRSLIDISDSRMIPRNKMFLACEYYFGLRPEETRGLMFSDFNIKSKQLTVSRAVSHDRNDCVIKTTKTDNVRVLPVPDAFIPVYNWYRSQVKTMFLFTQLDNDSMLITKSSQVKMWSSIKEQINLAMGGTDKINVLGDNFTFYIFRRTYATTLYYSGISIKKASYLMGHASLKMILELYAQLDDEKENLVVLHNII